MYDNALVLPIAVWMLGASRIYLASCVGCIEESGEGRDGNEI